MDREDFFRLKKVQGKKKRVQAERDIIDKENQRLIEIQDQKEADAAGKGGSSTLAEKRKKEKEEEEEGHKGDLLGGGEAEEDVIF